MLKFADNVPNGISIIILYNLHCFGKRYNFNVHAVHV